MQSAKNTAGNTKVKNMLKATQARSSGNARGRLPAQPRGFTKPPARKMQNMVPVKRSVPAKRKPSIEDIAKVCFAMVFGCSR